MLQESPLSSTVTMRSGKTFDRLLEPWHFTEHFPIAGFAEHTVAVSEWQSFPVYGAIREILWSPYSSMHFQLSPEKPRKEAAIPWGMRPISRSRITFVAVISERFMR